MDSRFIKKDKVNQKLKKILFKKYYENVKFFNQNPNISYSLILADKLKRTNIKTFQTFYGKEFNIKSEVTCNIILINNTSEAILGAFSGDEIFLLPEEIEQFSSEYELFLCEIGQITHKTFVTCCLKN